jgi:hypothetical protein
LDNLLAEGAKQQPGCEGRRFGPQDGRAEANQWQATGQFLFVPAAFGANQYSGAIEGWRVTARMGQRGVRAE